MQHQPNVELTELRDGSSSDHMSIGSSIIDTSSSGQEQQSISEEDQEYYRERRRRMRIQMRITMERYQRWQQRLQSRRLLAESRWMRHRRQRMMEEEFQRRLHSNLDVESEERERNRAERSWSRRALQRLLRRALKQMKNLEE